MCSVSTVSVQRIRVKYIGSYLQHFVIQASMDNTGIKAIRHWRFLLLTHVLSDFVLIELGNCVRAHSNKQFQRLQQMEWISPTALLCDSYLKSEFEDICRSVLSWETMWGTIYSSYQVIYPRGMGRSCVLCGFVRASMWCTYTLLQFVSVFDRERPMWACRARIWSDQIAQTNYA